METTFIGSHSSMTRTGNLHRLHRQQLQCDRRRQLYHRRLYILSKMLVSSTRSVVLGLGFMHSSLPRRISVVAQVRLHVALLSTKIGFVLIACLTTPLPAALFQLPATRSSDVTDLVRLLVGWLVGKASKSQPARSFDRFAAGWF